MVQACCCKIDRCCFWRMQRLHLMKHLHYVVEVGKRKARLPLLDRLHQLTGFFIKEFISIDSSCYPFLFAKAIGDIYGRSCIIK
jgi:hypothetical protein